MLTVWLIRFTFRPLFQGVGSLRRLLGPLAGLGAKVWGGVLWVSGYVLSILGWVQGSRP